MPLMQASEYVTEFIMTRLNGKSFVLVEGVTDRALWAEYAADDCQLRPAQGKDLILEVLRAPFLRDMPGIAGIVDADYWLITEADELGIANLLYDDCCPDMETILLRSCALRKVLRNQLYKCDIEAIHRFADKLTRESQCLAAEFGYFRLLNHIKDYGLKCNGINFADVIDLETLKLDSELVASKLTGDKPGLTSYDLLQEIGALKESYAADNPQLGRGKDVLAIMAIILPTCFAKEIGEELPPSSRAAFQEKALSISLRSAYDSAYFKQTALFGCIRSWENMNSPYKILKPGL